MIGVIRVPTRRTHNFQQRRLGEDEQARYGDGGIDAWRVRSLNGLRLRTGWHACQKTRADIAPPELRRDQASGCDVVAAGCCLFFSSRRQSYRHHRINAGHGDREGSRGSAAQLCSTARSS